MHMPLYLDRKTVIKKTSLSRCTIDRLEKAGDFPKHFLLTPRRAVWSADEIDAWITDRRNKNIAGRSNLPHLNNNKKSEAPDVR